LIEVIVNSGTGDNQIFNSTLKTKQMRESIASLVQLIVNDASEVLVKTREWHGRLDWLSIARQT